MKSRTSIYLPNPGINGFDAHHKSRKSHAQTEGKKETKSPTCHPFLLLLEGEKPITFRKRTELPGAQLDDVTGSSCRDGGDGDGDVDGDGGGGGVDGGGDGGGGVSRHFFKLHKMLG
jgi:hypothetical protein